MSTTESLTSLAFTGELICLAGTCFRLLSDYAANYLPQIKSLLVSGATGAALNALYETPALKGEIQLLNKLMVNFSALVKRLEKLQKENFNIQFCSLHTAMLVIEQYANFANYYEETVSAEGGTTTSTTSVGQRAKEKGKSLLREGSLIKDAIWYRQQIQYFVTFLQTVMASMQLDLQEFALEATRIDRLRGQERHRAIENLQRRFACPRDTDSKGGSGVLTSTEEKKSS
jgi:hypothetical protein